jgi:tyrosyl-tRNA synthetase
MVGDPGGRSEERNLLDAPTLATNVAAIKAQIAAILGPQGTWDLVDNLTWSADLRLLDFLRDVGKHVTVNQMVARDSVRTRMEGDHGISYTEFSYMLLQANDFDHLHQEHGCELQVGGSDQWGNILSGVDLIRRRRGVAVHALCWPLITAADGSKVGKTTGARVWLDPDLTSPYAFFQHWMQIDDVDLPRMLAQFTLLPMDEVDDLVAASVADPAARIGQRRLAHAVTELVHGAIATAAAAGATEVLFGGDARQASPDAVAAVAREVPSAALAPDDDLAGGVALDRLLVATGLASSLGDARRQLEQGGIAVNGEKVGAERRLVADDVLHGRWILVRKGKRGWALVDAAPAS